MDGIATQGSNAIQSRWLETGRVVDILVGALTLAFAATALWICRAKWINFDPYFLDFAKTARYYEHFIQGVPIENKFFNYGLLYSGYHLIVGPVYAALRSPVVIVLFHVAGFAVCIPLIYAIGKRHLGSASPAAVFALGFALNPVVDMMVIGFQRVEIWCGAALLATIWAFDRKNPQWALAAATVGGICRIDAIPAFVMLGVIYWVTKRHDDARRLIARSMLTFGVLIAALGIMRIVLGGGADADQLHLFVAQSDGPVLNRIARTVFEPDSYDHLRLLAHVAFLALFAPLWLLPALPSFGYMILTTQNLAAMEIVRTLLSPDNILVRQMHTHFVIVLPVVFVAAIMGVKRLTKFRVTEDGRVSGRRPRIESLALSAFFVAIHAAFSSGSMGAMPLTPGFRFSAYTDTPHAAVLRDVLSTLPRERFGVLQFSISERAPHLPLSREFYKVEDVDARVQYAVFDLFALSANIPKADLVRGIETTLHRDDFRVVRFEDGVVLCERGGRDGHSDAVLAFIDANREAILSGGRRGAQKPTPP
ncbi:MAG: DUF2079 domain-containing protein [Deltaproteobacteria bacterium]|nr:DUF2079 domain-containing protein [Deltaproteobacteria bacterium]